MIKGRPIKVYPKRTNLRSANTFRGRGRGRGGNPYFKNNYALGKGNLN